MATIALKQLSVAILWIMQSILSWQLLVFLTALCYPLHAANAGLLMPFECLQGAESSEAKPDSEATVENNGGYNRAQVTVCGDSGNDIMIKTIVTTIAHK